MGVELSTESK